MPAGARNVLNSLITDGCCRAAAPCCSNHFFIPAITGEINNNTLRIVWLWHCFRNKMCGKIILSRRSCWQLYCIYSIVVGSLVSLEAVARVAFLCSRQQQPSDQGYYWGLQTPAVRCPPRPPQSRPGRQGRCCLPGPWSGRGTHSPRGAWLPWWWDIWHLLTWV